MTTAARPTFDHAKGKEKSVVSSISHKRSLASHSKLKFRSKKSNKNAEFEEEEVEEDDNDEDTGDGRKIEGVESTTVVALRKEIESGSDNISDNEDDGDDESDDDDEEEDEILREMELLKKNREEQEQEPEKQLQIEYEDFKDKEKLINNEDNKVTKPVRKSWRRSKKEYGEKVVSEKDRFSNDTLKSDFHQDFLNKYIK